MKLFNINNTIEIFSMVYECIEYQDIKKHHPETSLLSHSLQVFKHACRESNDIDLILAALLHDVGKPIEPLGHDKVGADMIRPFVSAKTFFLVEQHMRIKTLLNGTMKKHSKVKELSGHPFLPELIMMCRWDLMGRNENVNIEFDRENIIDILNSKIVFPREVICPQL